MFLNGTQTEPIQLNLRGFKFKDIYNYEIFLYSTSAVITQFM